MTLLKAKIKTNKQINKQITASSPYSLSTTPYLKQSIF